MKSDILALKAILSALLLETNEAWLKSLNTGAAEIY
jgi:hypothetical protein